MTRRVLPLAPEALSMPTRHHVATLEAVMLWPHDPDAQNKWVVAAQLQHAPQLINDMGPESRRELVELLLTAPRIVDLTPEAQEQMKFGVLLGNIVLWATVLAKHAPKDASVMAIRQRVAAQLSNRRRGRGAIMPVSANSLENKAHPTYRLRPVAHLWALYALAVHEEDRLDPFPCSPEALPQFIADAECFGDWATSRRAPKANTPVLRPAELMRVAASIRGLLPERRLEDIIPTA